MGSRQYKQRQDAHPAGELHMTLRDKIIAAYPLDAYFDNAGRKVQPKGPDKAVACCPFHDDKHPSMSIDVKRGLWKCFVCDIGGTVIDAHMRITGATVKDAMFDLAEKRNIPIDDKPTVAATYQYSDKYGNPVMCVDRIEQGKKKKFSQYRIDADGNRVNGIDGVSRVLYRMERWHSKQVVCLCEGEKCVHALESLDFDATTNPGGSSGWMDAYATYLADKDVEIWPDNDEPGRKWCKAVIDSLAGKVKRLRVITVPHPYNDVADMVDAQGIEQASETFFKLSGKSDWIERGIKIDLLSASEIVEAYEKRVKATDENAVNLALWLPSFRHHTRPLMPGDMMLVLADTGVGKTGILTNIAYSQRHIPIVFFELELAPESMAERFIARDSKMESMEVERAVKAGKRFKSDGWSHVYFCPNSKMTVPEMEELIDKSELKIGRRPALVLVDYVGLVSGGGGKRYERMSQIAEDMKRLARATNTVVCVASQVARKEDRINISLHDSKDSGSLENSAQLVIGAWRPQVDQMTLKILKQTRMAGQFEITCNYDGNRQMITEAYDEGGAVSHA